MNKKLFQILNNKNLTISTAESFTGGMYSSSIVSFSGSSKIFKGGIVAYSKESKNNLLEINLETLNKNGTISSQTSIEMAIQIRNIFKTDLGISFTGNSGPRPDENKPIGLFYISISSEKINETKKYIVSPKWNRKKIQQYSLKKANNFLKDFIIKNNLNN